MAWTTPRTWSSGEIVTAAQLNQHVRDNLDYLYLNRKKLLDYQQITGNVSVTATAFGSANAVINGTSIAYDGVTPILFEFYAPKMEGVAGNALLVGLFDGSTHVATLCESDQERRTTGWGAHRFTPTAANHTYQVKAWMTTTGTGTVYAGTGGGSGAYAPAYLRITTDGT